MFVIYCVMTRKAPEAIIQICNMKTFNFSSLMVHTKKYIEILNIDNYNNINTVTTREIKTYRPYGQRKLNKYKP